MPEKKTTAKKATKSTRTGKKSTKTDAKKTTAKSTQKASGKTKSTKAKAAPASKGTSKTTAKKATASKAKATTASKSKAKAKQAETKTPAKATKAKPSTQKAAPKKAAAKKETQQATTSTKKAAATKKATPKSTASKSTAKQSAQSTEKIRVYALAKEVGMNSKELLSLLQDHGLAVSSIQSNITRGEAQPALEANSGGTSTKKSTKTAKASKQTGDDKKPKKAAKKPAKASTKKQSSKAQAAASKDSSEEPEDTLQARLEEASAVVEAQDPVENFSRLVANRPETKGSLGIKVKLIESEDDEDDDLDDFEEIDDLDDEPEVAEVDEPLNEEPLAHGPRSKAHAYLSNKERRKRQSPPPRRHRQREDSGSYDNFDSPDDTDEFDDTSDVPAGMVKIKSFHPDVVPGGGYIEQFVPADQVPYGAIVVSGKPRSGRRQESQRRSSQQGDREVNGNQRAMLPPGGILEAGRKLVSEGRWNSQARTSSDTSTPEPTPAPTAPKPAPAAPQAPPVEAPVTTSATASAQSPAAVAGVGASFLQGLPSANRFSSNAAQSAKDALNAAFGGLSSKPAAAVPAAPKPAPATKPAATIPSKPATPARGTTHGRGRSMILDGRMIDTPSARQDKQDIALTRLRPLDAPHEQMRIFELQVEVPSQKPVDAHALLWTEGQIGLMGRVNDSDPRPRVWAEEGIFGLGRDEREQDLQRWSLREWWEGLETKGHTPIAGFAGSRTIRDTLQVAFVYDADYNIYRLYQPAGLELAGEYPMLIAAEGFIKMAWISLDGVGERERITPERMAEILGEHNPPSPADLIFTAAPCMIDGEPLPLQEPEHLAQLRDQLDGLFRFPILELPDPLGGTGSIKLHLGLWEMSQNDDNGSDLRAAAAAEKSLTFKASSGYISDLVRRELWRMKGQPAQLWGGYTPKQVAEAIRVALREDHYNMQGFQPKKPGDYCYDPETGAFQIVLKRKHSTHTLLMRGHDGDEGVLCALVLYSSHKDNEGLNPLTDYARLLQSGEWDQMWPDVQWQEAWLLAPGGESRCAWAGPQGLPHTPAVRHMPAWHRGVALGVFLLSF